MIRSLAVIASVCLCCTAIAQRTADALPFLVNANRVRAVCESQSTADPLAVIHRYQEFLDAYGKVLCSEGLPALDAVTAAERSQLILHASAAHAAVRNSLNQVIRKLVALEQEMFSGLVKQETWSADAFGELTLQMRCSRMRDQCRSYIAPLNPAVLFDLTEAIDSLQLTASVSQRIAPELHNYRVRLVQPLEAIGVQSAEMFEKVSAELESRGYILADGQCLMNLSSALPQRQQEMIEVWSQVVRDILSQAAAVEREHWECAARLDGELSLSCRLTLRSEMLRALLTPMDDGSTEKELADALRVASSDALRLLAEECLSRKGGVLPHAMQLLADVRAERRLFTGGATQLAPKLDRLRANFREISDSTREQMRTLGLGTHDPVRVDVPSYPQTYSWSRAERVPLAQVAAERRWLAPIVSAAIPLVVTISSSVEGAVDGGAIAARGDSDRIRKDFVSRASVNWERVTNALREGGDDVDFLGPLQAVATYCAAEVKMLEQAALLDAASCHAAGESAGACRMAFLVSRCGSSAFNPFGDAGGEWCVDLFDGVMRPLGLEAEVKELSDSYYAAVLPHHEARFGAWLRWRRAAISTAVVQAVAERVWQLTDEQLLEADWPLREAVGKELKLRMESLATATRELRLAEVDLAKENRRWLIDIESRGPGVGTALQREYCRSCLGKRTAGEESKSDQQNALFSSAMGEFQERQDTYLLQELDMRTGRLSAPYSAELPVGGAVVGDACNIANARLAVGLDWISFAKRQAESVLQWRLAHIAKVD